MTYVRPILSLTLGAALLGTVGLSAASTQAQGLPDCDDIESAVGGDIHAALSAALSSSVYFGGVGGTNGGFDLNMWATIVDRDGRVCAVTFTGSDRGDQWPGSRVISAQKANTANAFSLPFLALSTANLWAATQPGGSLFGLQFSNPVDTEAAYEGSVTNIGTSMDPLEGEKPGGVNVFGGGLALYADDGEGGSVLLGAVGVSGDTSCADHNIAWRTRDQLGLDFVPGGVGTPVDNMIFDIQSVTAVDHQNHPATVSTSGFGHPRCSGPQGDPDDAVDNANVVSACPPGDGATPGCV